MTVAPIPLVAALRETSVLVAALISLSVVREPLLACRAAAAAIILAGIAALRLA